MKQFAETWPLTALLVVSLAQTQEPHALPGVRLVKVFHVRDEQPSWIKYNQQGAHRVSLNGFGLFQRGAHLSNERQRIPLDKADDTC